MAAHPWQVAKGPVAALQCYLKDHGWQAESCHYWTKLAPNNEPEFQISMSDSWLTIKAELKRAEKSDRLQRISSRSMLQEVQRPLDWKPWERTQRTLHPEGHRFANVASGRHLHQDE